MPIRSPTPGDNESQTVAIQALGWLAADPRLLARFLAMTGIEAGAIRSAASEPGFLSGVLEFICAHEPTLTAFAGESGIAPQRVADARAALAGRGDGVWDST